MTHSPLPSATYPNYSLTLGDNISLVIFGFFSLLIALLSRIALFATITEEQDPILMIFNIYHVRPIWLSLDSIFECVSTTIKLFMAVDIWIQL